MTLAITLFLLVAGLEVDLSSIWRQGKLAINVGVAGIVVPFAVGFGAAWFLPQLMGIEAGADPCFSPCSWLRPCRSRRCRSLPKR